jgi:hypothetical protein
MIGVYESDRRFMRIRILVALGSVLLSGGCKSATEGCTGPQIAFSPSAIALREGGSAAFSTFLTTCDDTTGTQVKPRLTSRDTTVARVDSATARVTAVSAGTTSIVAELFTAGSSTRMASGEVGVRVTSLK